MGLFFVKKLNLKYKRDIYDPGRLRYHRGRNVTYRKFRINGRTSVKQVMLLTVLVLNHRHLVLEQNTFISIH